MTTTCPNKKNKIDLKHYNYKKDIDNRLLLADLTFFEVDILREIVDGSLKIPIATLADNLGITTKQLLPALEKLGITHLFLVSSDLIHVDKEMRKYFETQLLKFDESFKPGIEFLQTLLNKVPIDILHSWYPACRASDSIWQAIMEKYLVTPKIYNKYLEEIQFEDPIINKIISDIFHAENYKVSSKELLKKYSLSRETLEKYLLHLEFNFIGYLSYEKTESGWEEVITPIYEWTEYLKHTKQIQPKQPKNLPNVPSEEFYFLKSLKNYLKQIQKEKTFTEDTSDFFQTAKFLGLVKKKNEKEYVASPVLSEWLETDLTEQAAILYKQTLIDLCSKLSYTDQDVRKIEKSLKRIAQKEWVLYDEFVKGFSCNIGNTPAISLQKKGKNWKYQYPTYLEEELEFIHYNICERLPKLGMVDVFTYEGNKYIRLTPFGKIAIFE